MVSSSDQNTLEDHYPAARLGSLIFHIPHCSFHFTDHFTFGSITLLGFSPATFSIYSRKLDFLSILWLCLAGHAILWRLCSSGLFVLWCFACRVCINVWSVMTWCNECMLFFNQGGCKLHATQLNAHFLILPHVLLPKLLKLCNWDSTNPNKSKIYKISDNKTKNLCF